MYKEFIVNPINSAELIKYKYNLIFAYCDISFNTNIYIKNNNYILINTSYNTDIQEMYCIAISVNDTTKQQFIKLNNGINQIYILNDSYIFISNIYKDIQEISNNDTAKVDIKYDLFTCDYYIVETKYCYILIDKYINKPLNIDIIDNYMERNFNICQLSHNIIQNKIFIDATTYNMNIRDSLIMVNRESMLNLLNINDYKLDWCILHEIGHLFEGAITLPGCIESTVNLFSNIYHLDNNIQTRNESIIQYTCNDSFFNRDCWNKMQMYLDLYNMFGESFYNKLYINCHNDKLDIQLNEFNNITANDTYLKFVKKCCDISNVNLYDFFNNYGFFVNDMNFTINDYVTYNISVSKQDLLDIKTYCDKYPTK